MTEAHDSNAEPEIDRAGPGLGATELRSLLGWLEKEGIEADGSLRATLIAGGRSNLTYRLTDARNDWVLRRPPLGAHTASAHDVAREYRVVKALSSTNVPVAAAVAATDDAAVIGAPFAITEFVQGRAIRAEWELDSLDQGALENVVDGLIRALVRLHQVDHVDVGLADFGRATGYAERQLRRWAGQWEVVGAQASAAEATAAAEVLRRLQPAVPTQHHARIVHGDYRIDNTLLNLDTGEVNAVIDWELSTIGDPVADVALMCVYRAPTLNAILGFDAAWTSARLPSVDQLAARYIRAGGVELDNWDYWMALSSYKLAIIAAGIDYRWRSGATVGDGFDTAGRAVEPLLQQALTHAARV